MAACSALQSQFLHTRQGQVLAMQPPEAWPQNEESLQGGDGAPQSLAPAGSAGTKAGKGLLALGKESYLAKQTAKSESLNHWR